MSLSPGLYSTFLHRRAVVREAAVPGAPCSNSRAALQHSARHPQAGIMRK